MNRREFVGGATAAAMSLASCAREVKAASEWVYVGPYTRGASKGIYRLSFEPESGKMGEPALAAETPSPSFLDWHPSKRFLYAVNEVSEFKGERGGSVTSFRVDAQSGDLAELNAVSTKGPGPCHLMVSPDGKALVVVNYSGGNTASFTLGTDGRISEAVSVIQHEGSGPNQQRQKGPHAHGVAMRNHKGKLVAYVADLGIDKILAFSLDTASGKLAPWEAQPAVSLAPGAGPRHVVVHPNGQFAFVINELSSTLTVFRIDPDSSIWTQTDNVRTLPDGFAETSWTAEVAVHPNGKFVYGSNRGHDSLAVFALDADSGKLAPKGHVSTEGKTPRNFAIHPSGKALIAANQGTGNLVSYTIDEATGMPKSTGEHAKVDMPVSVVFG